MNLGELQTALGDLLEVDDDRLPGAVRTRYLNKAIRGLEFDLEGPWTTDTGSLPVTAGDNEYHPATEITGASLVFSQPELVFYAIDGGAREIEYLSWSDFTGLYRLRVITLANPLYYAMRGGWLFLGPTPIQTMTVSVDFMGHAPPLVAPGDSNSWTAEASDLVLAEAAAHLCAWLLEDERAPVFQAEAMAERESLVLHWSHLHSRGRVMEGEEV
ncbi:MAG: hypothetical protein K8R59_17410 [Thermoanaerobaculales bacterium]|nr:hypothetical protein [Thermoanaerobaculales bacterium]